MNGFGHSSFGHSALITHYDFDIRHSLPVLISTFVLALSLSRPALHLRQQWPERIDKVIQAVKFAIDTREADERDMVQLMQVFEDELANAGAFDLRLEAGEQLIFEFLDGRVDLAIADRSFPTRPPNPSADLLPIVGHAGAVFLDHFECGVLDGLIGCEAAAAVVADATPPGRQPILACPRVDHAVIVDLAIRALHRTIL